MSKESEITILRKEMKDEFNKINETLMKLIKAVETLNGSCSKMDDHINFVECTYETLKSPLDYITDSVNRLRGIETTRLPEIEDFQ